MTEEIKPFGADASREKFVELAEPLMKWLADNHHPHTQIVIECDEAVLWEGQLAHVNSKFIRD